MRESIGATWLLGIVLVFIALFSGFLAFSINYSKAFRVKDGIIERLEKYNGPSEKAINDIKNLIDETSYTSKGDCSKVLSEESGKIVGVTSGDKPQGISTNKTYHYCIQKVNAGSTNGQMTSSYYRVVVFFSLSLPVFNMGFSFHVDGETGNIQFPNEYGF